MINRNKVKKEALEKFDKLVASTIKYYIETNDIDALTNIIIPDKYFSIEQYEEIRGNLDYISGSLIRLVSYCQNRDIDIPHRIIESIIQTNK